MKQNSIKNTFGIGLAFLALTVTVSFTGPREARADCLEDIGYAALKAELGDRVPDGSGVPVGHVEASSSRGWRPDPRDPEFFGKRFVFPSNQAGGFSGHSTMVGRLFYGNRSSMAPGIKEIACYEAGDWMRAGVIRSGSNDPPRFTRSRVVNHSWVGDAGDQEDVLRRMDWIVETDETLMVVASCLKDKPLLGAGFNGIVVGRTSGESSSGTPDVSELYASGRACPHVVVPKKNLSRSTPVVAAAAALLVGFAKENPDLSSDAVSVKTTNHHGVAIHNAERTEVIKAVLMAGADRRTTNGSEWDITDYREKEADRTDNGLDFRFGAGQLNIQSSCHILSRGEQNSREDRPEGGGLIRPLGFDYDPAFGGVAGSNKRATYFLRKVRKAGRLHATLAWNLDVRGGSILHHLSLSLRDVTDPHNERLVASSKSRDDNTETLWTDVRAGRDYMLLVAGEEGAEPFRWDYALAWRLEPER